MSSNEGDHIDEHIHEIIQSWTPSGTLLVPSPHAPSKFIDNIDEHLLQLIRLIAGTHCNWQWLKRGCLNSPSVPSTGCDEDSAEEIASRNG
jgi:hypothetical protein